MKQNLDLFPNVNENWDQKIWAMPRSANFAPQADDG